MSKMFTPVKPRFRIFKREVFRKALKVGEFVHQIGEYEYLRRKSRYIPISSIKSQDVKAKIKYVKDCLLQYRKLTGYGRGITAVQLGIPERFSVIYKGQTITNIRNTMQVDYKDLEVVINPTITKESNKLLRYPEMCMSANPIIVPTIRPSWIEFEYYDENGILKKWNTKDETEVGKMMNRVYQHEFDHMDGIINIDRVEDPREMILQSDPGFYTNAKFEEI